MSIVTPEQKAQFEADGCFILPDFFTPAEMDALAADIERHTQRHNARLREVGSQGISRPDEIQFTAHLAEQDEAICAFATQHRMAQLAVDILGTDVWLYWNQSVIKHPETPREFPWHQDNGYTPVIPEQYLTCWLAVSDATLENGCIWVRPGSHKNGTLPHVPSPIGQVGYDGPDPGVPVPLRQGSLAVFSSLLLHKSGPNRTASDVRKAYIMQYCVAHTRSGRTGQEFTDKLWVARAGPG